MTDFRRLDVWQLGRELTRNVYTVTRPWPAEERFGLVSQSRRVAISICSNIAEGSAREARDFQRFATMALGSANELESLLQISIDVGLRARRRAHDANGSSHAVGTNAVVVSPSPEGTARRLAR